MNTALVLACTLCGCVALDMKWTPNGEAPAPFSKKAREQMGIDPSSFAGSAQPVARGSTLRLGVGSLLVLYMTHNWNAILALQVNTRYDTSIVIIPRAAAPTCS